MIQNYKDYMITVETQEPSVPEPQTEKEWDDLFEKENWYEVKGTHKYTIYDKNGELIDEDDQNMWDTQACLDNAMNEIEHDINSKIKINKDLVISFNDILADEKGIQPTYNNQNFYECSEQRLRYKFNELDTEFYKENKFYKCFDQDTLKILKPKEWEELSKMSLEDMMKNYVEKYKWEWLGDDFEDMDGYLNFVMTHNKDIVFSSKIRGEDDYMDIYMHDVSMYNDKEKEIYCEGLYEGSSK